MINGYARETVIQNSNFHEIGDNIIVRPACTSATAV